MTMDRTKLTERRFEFQARALPVEGSEEQELWVEGYAVRFDSPTVLFEYDGTSSTKNRLRGTRSPTAKWRM